MRKTIGILLLLATLFAAPLHSQTKETRAKVEQISLLISEGKKDKADKLFNEILRNLPDNKSVIVSTAYLFRGRLLNDYALEVLNKGAEINTDHDPFYMERAEVSQSMNNYQQAFEYYFLALEANPKLYNNVKNRFQTLLLYDVNKSIADEMRIALLKKNQEHPDNMEFGKMLVWFALQEEDYEIALAQCKSIDQRSNDQDGQIVNLAKICYENGQYDLAKEAFEYVVDKGKIKPLRPRTPVANSFPTPIARLTSD